MAVPEKSDQATDAEIERERVKWTTARLAEHLDFVKQFSFHASSKFMDYLHGDVDEEEAEFACRYEYARELKAIWEAAKRRDELKAKGMDSEKSSSWAYQEGELVGHTSFPFDTLNFLDCESFPKKDWEALTPAERKAVARSERKKIPPLPMTDVLMLETFRIFDRFKAMAEEAKPIVEDHDPQRDKYAKPYKAIPPILQHDDRLPIYYAIFNLDYSKSETQLVKEFLEWLKLPENQQRLESYKKSKIGTTGKPLDRLKDLAAWRLYRECGNDWEKANDFADKHRKKFTNAEIRQKFKTRAQRDKFQTGSNKQFRDAKWQAGKPANEADLFGEDADARKAQASAWEYMVEIMPQEFAPPGPHMLAMMVEIGKLESKS